MAASFEEKVEALKRLREKRLARAADAEKRHESTPQLEAETAHCSGLSSAAPSSCPQAIDSNRLAVAETERGAGAKNPFAALATSLSQGSNSEPKLDPAEFGGAGEFDALYCTGYCYERGVHGCVKDETMAAYFYRVAAEGGHTVAQWRLGELCEFGRGIDQNNEEAARWYRLAADAGHMHAQVGLALLLEEGRGVAVDNAEAFRWHLSAAEGGHVLAQYCAACCYIEGRGVHRDLAEALRWLRLSAAAGFPPARSLLAANQQAARHEGHDETAAQGDVRGERSVVELAQQLAQQLGELPDSEAEMMLDELLASSRGASDDDDAIPLPSTTGPDDFGEDCDGDDPDVADSDEAVHDSRSECGPSGEFKSPPVASLTQKSSRLGFRQDFFYSY